MNKFGVKAYVSKSFEKEFVDFRKYVNKVHIINK